jgi:ribosomal protein S18 acetylase RimI-like enzyme
VSSKPIRIRPSEPSDLDDLYNICLLTSDVGGDGTRLFSDPKLPGHLYVAPYAIFEPSLAFVAEGLGGVGGYVVAAFDTVAFQERLELQWWPALRDQYAEPSGETADSMSAAELRARRNIHHPRHIDPDLVRDYPSHLHIDLLPGIQGRGVGRRLIEALADALRGQGSRGLHLFVSDRNERAQRFYRHVGFTELPTEDPHTFVMDLANAPR